MNATHAYIQYVSVRKIACDHSGYDLFKSLYGIYNCVCDILFQAD